ncbi:hypothetical protein MRX96_009619 [Rhipicephalus microplus]
MSCVSSLRNLVMVNFWCFSRVSHWFVVTSAALFHCQKDPRISCRLLLAECPGVALLRHLLTSSSRHQLPRHRLSQLPLQDLQRRVCAHGRGGASGLLCG